FEIAPIGNVGEALQNRFNPTRFVVARQYDRELRSVCHVKKLQKDWGLRLLARIRIAQAFDTLRRCAAREPLESAALRSARPRRPRCIWRRFGLRSRPLLRHRTSTRTRIGGRAG